MNLSEVKDLFNEIVDNCPTVEGIHFMIAPSIAPNTIVDGYQLHMSGKKFDEKTIQYLKDLAVKNGLFIDSKDSSAGMYKVKKGVLE